MTSAQQDEKRMPGYTGYKPQFADDQAIINQTASRDNRFYIPGKSPYNKNYYLASLSFSVGD